MSSSKIVPTKIFSSQPTIDLYLWSSKRVANWALGKTCYIPSRSANLFDQINQWVRNSSSDYILFAENFDRVPYVKSLLEIVEDEVDLAHIGLEESTNTLLPELQMIIHDWSMIQGPKDTPRTSWLMGIRNFFVRRDLLVQMDGFDTVFNSPDVTGLDLGYRCFHHGALMEFRPRLFRNSRKQLPNEIESRDRYSFVIRNFGYRWANYVALRRILQTNKINYERDQLQKAKEDCARIKVPKTQSIWYGRERPSAELSRTEVSVVIPTLGRYSYLRQALDSIRNQTIPPTQVIVIDQNPEPLRKPNFYREFPDLEISVVWQDEQGQSHARNAGLSSVQTPWVFLFDDDSVAEPDCIEKHLRIISDGRFHVSTGVSLPPPPTKYELPVEHRQRRVATTFDTGNCLIPLQIANKVGRFDRIYDYGPGADADFGTRLYLSGFRIAHNPDAIRLHYKAPLGGLRQHGVFKYNTDSSLFAPFPPPTRNLYGLQYLDPVQRREQILLSFLTSRFSSDIRRNPQNILALLTASVSLLVGLILFPVKYYRSQRQAKALSHRKNVFNSPVID